MATRTFLFVDQVGSTAQLTALGDAVAQEVRRALFDTLRQATAVAGGHEVDFTGDGLFCAFDGAADAVDAAVAMQQLVVSFNRRRPVEQHLAIRIGLHTGEPLESEGGGYFGAAVVVAARLCSQAAPGQVLASGLVRGLVEPRGVHRFEPVGALELKGVPEPVETFEVAWAPDERAGRLPGLLTAARTGPFVGRATEIATVSAAWEGLAASGGRRLVVVSGDRGSGVSRLLAEAAAALQQRGASVWAGTGHGEHARLAPWAEAVGAWAAGIPRAELRIAAGQRASDLARLVPGLAELLPGLSPPVAMDPGAEVFLIADALDELATRWSAIEPLVVVLDDLEQADPATVTVLQRLLRSRRGGRVLVLSGYEPSAVGTPRLLAALQDLNGVLEVRLGGLTAPEVTELVTAITGEPTEQNSLRGVLAESEGSPYFVLEMARSLKERSIGRQVRQAVDRAGELRTDLRLQREEITLALRQLEQLREPASAGNHERVDPDGTPPAPGAPPYRGLLAFQPEDGELFFGRDALVAEMVAALLSSRWLAVLGPSGSGKSSAVRAGLLSALAGGALPESGDWVSAVCTPGPDPLGALGAALAGIGGSADGPGLAGRLRSEPLASVTAGVSGGRRLVLVVDQFEELWTTAHASDRERTLDLLVTAVTGQDDAVLVVVCMRADHYGLAADHPDLAILLAESQVLVPPMSTAELRAAIELPAKRAGWVLEPGLTQAVLDDVEGEAGALPLLSTAMLETWERRRGRSLTLAGYAETGGARRAIATLADATLAELSPPQQETARRLLLRLAAPAPGGGDVARPAPLAELADDEDTRTVLARLVDRRLVTVGASTAQVAHEALLREWPRLRTWLEADRDGRRLHQQIATAATDWDTGGRDAGALLRGARLAAAEDWRGDHETELTALEREFLTASAEARQAELGRARRTTRRFQVLAGVLVVLLLGAVVAGGFAVVNGRAATQRATEALARGLTGQSAALGGTDVDTALLLAVEAHRRNPSIETEGALLTALDRAAGLLGPADGLPPDGLDVAVSPDGETLALLTASGALSLHDATDFAASGEPLVEGIVNPFYAEFTPDGDEVVWSDVDGVHVVPTDGSAGPDELGGGAQAVFAFDSTGEVLAIASSLPWPGSEISGVRLLAWDTRRELTTIEARGFGVTAVRPGAAEVLVPVEIDAVQRYAFDGSAIGDPVPIIPSQLLAYSPSGDIFVSMSGGLATLHDADTLQQIGVPIESTGSSFYDAAFSPDEAHLLLTSDDGTLSRHWLDGTLVDRFGGFGGTSSLALLADGRVLSVAPDATVEYDLDRPAALGSSAESDELLGHLAVTPDGTVLTVRAGDDVVAVGPGTEMRPTAVQDLPLEGALALAVTGDGARVAVLGFSATGLPVVIADRGTGEVLVEAAVEMREEDAFGGGRLAFSPDGSRLAVGGPDGSVTILDGVSGEVLARDDLDSQRAEGLLWSTDGSRLYQGGFEGVLRSLDPATLEPAVEGLRLPGPISDIIAVPGGDELAVASRSGDVHFVDIQAWAPSREPIRAGGTELEGLAVSPDGRRLAAISRDGALRLWRVEDGRAVGPPLQGHPGPGLGLAWPAPEGLLTTGYGDTAPGTLIAWDTSPGGWVDRACTLAGRDLTRDEWDRYLPDQPYRATCSGR